ncbi:MAG: ABC transporter ATP-binding protein [Rhizobiaceae bacterium]|nr:ABC transporter ATP-binding protein [Rhizobiaceae bacterium]
MNPKARELVSIHGKPVAVRGLTKAYGAVKAVDDVTLEVNAGEFVALLGPSGSGKTTILMTIAGFETPDIGTIEVGGRDITALPAGKREIGMVFQRYALFPHMTVAENIAFPLKMRKIGGRDAAAQVEAALAMVRLEGYGGRRIGQLSGGQQQRVALARAMVYQPPLLLMDEPLGALDKNLREEMQLEIKRLQKKLGATVVYVTHDQGEALTMANRIAVMSDGRIQQFATPMEIYDRPANLFVAGFVGETNLIDGELARDGAAWRFRLAGSADTVALEGQDAVDGWRDGMRAKLMVRPELVRVGPIRDGAPSGLVEELIYSGGTVVCMVRLPSGAMATARIAAADAAGVTVGDTVGLEWPADRVRVFAA